MKTKKIFKLLLLTFLFVGFTSCSDDDDNNSTPQVLDIVDTAIATADLSNLVAALQAADGNLPSVLKGNGPFTVLAPTNAAFEAFLSENNFASLADVPTDVLAQVLLNHVIAGEIPSTDLAEKTGYANTQATGAGGGNMSLYYDGNNGVTFNGIAKVVTADVKASNGIVHVVDKVIALPTVVTFALADSNFSNLVAALTRSDLETNFVSVLSTPNGTSPAPFTIFAPTDTAFANLLTELNVSELGDIAEPTLRATLTYHVIAGANVTSANLTDGTVTTLGGDITASKTNSTITDANERVSNIVATDVQASNGVIHAIDKVILPPLEN